MNKVRLANLKSRNKSFSKISAIRELVDWKRGDIRGMKPDPRYDRSTMSRVLTDEERAHDAMKWAKLRAEVRWGAARAAKATGGAEKAHFWFHRRGRADTSDANYHDSPVRLEHAFSARHFASRSVFSRRFAYCSSTVPNIVNYAMLVADRGRLGRLGRGGRVGR